MGGISAKMPSMISFNRLTEPTTTMGLAQIRSKGGKNPGEN